EFCSLYQTGFLPSLLARVMCGQKTSILRTQPSAMAARYINPQPRNDIFGKWHPCFSPRLLAAPARSCDPDFWPFSPWCGASGAGCEEVTRSLPPPDVLFRQGDWMKTTTPFST
ncbi:hypothetical protein, partial [Aeromonas caviae]|uniref:hypothetical protein n=1 Tax=Aeromonas caviae TaxID=648 RepID=UPI003014828B